MEGNGFDLARVEVAAALGEGLRMRERPLHRSGPAQQAVLDGQDVFPHHSQSRKLPEQIRHFLDDAGAAVLNRQDRAVDGAYREGLERQPEGCIPNRVRAGNSAETASSE